MANPELLVAAGVKLPSKNFLLTGAKVMVCEFGLTLNDFTISAAALKFALPACEAVMFVVPNPTIWILLATIVATLVLLLV
ncbi:hypothetical protein D9M68_505640 [compost metagenome]